MDYFYSKKENAFYPASFKEAYIAAGTLPDDLVEVESSVFTEFSACPPPGKIRAAGADGLPCWADTPQKILSEDEVKAQARSLRDSFIKATDRMLLKDYSICDVPLSEEQLSEVLAVRAIYKSWPAQDGWPLIALPEIPRWILIEAVNNGYVVANWPE